MKNTYNDASSKDGSKDIFSSTELETAFRKAEKAEADKEKLPKTPRSKPVRSVKQAPPPIRKTTPPTAAVPPVSATPYPGAPVFTPQPGYYPQPVYYQPDPNQPPVPVYYAPVPGQPVTPQPVMPYAQVPYYQPAPTSEAVPFPGQSAPEAPQPKEPEVKPAPQANDAGTRVLYQSEDFDKKEDFSEEHETLPDDFTYSPVSFDVSEVELPSKKHKKKAPEIKVKPVSFKIDEMEIGTYELGIMTAGQSSKVTSVELPSENDGEPELYTEEATDEKLAFFDEIAQPDILAEAQTEEEKNEAPVQKVTAPASQAVKAPVQKPEAPEIKVSTVKKEESGKKLSTKEIIRRCVLGVSCAAIIGAGLSLVNEYRLHKQNEQLMSNISNLIITDAPAQESTTAAEEVNGTTKVPSVSITIPTTTRPLTPEEQWAQIKLENPELTFPENMQLKYARLYAENPDCVGYLYAEGSELDTPLVQGEDNEEYIEKNFYGEYTKYACPFVSATNTIESLDTNTVIYGHHMRDGSIFACLDQYRSLEGYKEAPVISYNTIYQDYNFKVIATFITNSVPSSDNGYIFNYTWNNLNNELNFNAYLSQLKQRSLYDTGVDVVSTDKLLTLSTCCTDFDDARLVVVARLVRPGESLEVDTSRATENDNPRFPQAYYSAKGWSNPYANAYKWYIS